MKSQFRLNRRSARVIKSALSLLLWFQFCFSLANQMQRWWFRERANQISAWWFTCETSEQCIWYGRWRSREWSNISKGSLRWFCVCYFLRTKIPIFDGVWSNIRQYHGRCHHCNTLDKLAWKLSCRNPWIRSLSWLIKNPNHYLSATFSGNGLADFIVVLFGILGRGSFLAWFAAIKTILLVIVLVVRILKLQVKFCSCQRMTR